MATRKNTTPTTPTTPDPTTPTTPDPTTPTTPDPTTPTTPDPLANVKVSKSLNKSVVDALTRAALAANIHLFDESAACGGGYFDGAIIVAHEGTPVWAYPLNIHHKRVTPCKWHGADPRKCPDWYVEATSKTTRKTLVTDENGIRHTLKVDAKGDYIPVRMAFSTYFNQSVHPVFENELVSVLSHDVNWLGNVDPRKWHVYIGTDLTID